MMKTITVFAALSLVAAALPAEAATATASVRIVQSTTVRISALTTSSAHLIRNDVPGGETVEVRSGEAARRAMQSSTTAPARPNGDPGSPTPTLVVYHAN
jgi:hypothetical protein